MKHLIVFFILLSLLTPAQSKDSHSGKKAPEFKLENIDGGYSDLKSFTKNGPVLLSFWATWCKPCMEEMGEFQKMYNELKDKGFTLVAISIDNEKSVSKVKPYVKTKGFSSPVLLDTNSDIARKYYATVIPTSVLIDKNGTIIESHTGYKKGDEITMKAKILELLK